MLFREKGAIHSPECLEEIVRARERLRGHFESDNTGIGNISGYRLYSIIGRNLW
jgi:hypothetical protein